MNLEVAGIFVIPKNHCLPLSNKFIIHHLTPTWKRKNNLTDQHKSLPIIVLFYFLAELKITLSFLFIYHHRYAQPRKKLNHEGIFFNIVHSVIISSNRIESQVVSLSGYGMLTYISTLILPPLLGLIIYRQE